MSAITAEKAITPEEFLTLPNRELYQLVDGALVERHVSVMAGHVAGNIHFLIKTHLKNTGHQGWVFPDGAEFLCFPNKPNQIRKPDTAFVEKDRLSIEEVERAAYVRVAPDLSVEVVSPNDTLYEIKQRVEEMIEAGARLVWVVQPRSRSVVVHRRDGSVQHLRAEDELSGEDVLAGFRCKVSDLFAFPGA